MRKTNKKSNKESSPDTSDGIAGLIDSDNIDSLLKASEKLTKTLLSVRNNLKKINDGSTTSQDGASADLLKIRLASEYKEFKKAEEKVSRLKRGTVSSAAAVASMPKKTSMSGRGRGEEETMHTSNGVEILTLDFSEDEDDTPEKDTLQVEGATHINTASDDDDDDSAKNSDVRKSSRQKTAIIKTVDSKDKLDVKYVSRRNGKGAADVVCPDIRVVLSSCDVAHDASPSRKWRVKPTTADMEAQRVCHSTTFYCSNKLHIF